MYRHLEEAQHLGLVPRFYGETEIHMSSETAPDHPAFQSVRGIILEYIPGETLHSFLMRKGKKQRDEVFHKVIALAHEMRPYGAIHNDLHFANIILREPDQTPVIIDWGRADIEMVDSPRLADRWSESEMWPDFVEEIQQYLGKGITSSSRYPDSSLTPNEKALWDLYAREFAKRSLSSWKRERLRRMGNGQRNGAW